MIGSNQDIDNKQKVFLSHSELSDKLIADFIPVALTTTLLAPINRIKICLQTMSMMSINQNEKTFRARDLARSIKFKLKFSIEIVKEQGFYSFWRGNTANTYRLLSQTFANIMINTKINNFLRKITNDKNNFISRLISSSLSSSICLIFSYPFELAHTRMTADITRYGHKKLYSSVLELFTKIIVQEEGVMKLYKGFSIALISNALYWSITFSCFDRLNKYFHNKIEKSAEDFEYLSFIRKISILFGATTLTAIITSIFVYPLDTFKRQIQVNSSLGFKSEYHSLSHGIKKFYAEGFLHMYRGFSMNLCKLIPFSFIQYTFYSSLNVNKKVVFATEY